MSDSAKATILSAVPRTRHWSSLEAIVDRFGPQYHCSNVDDLVLLLGKKSYKKLLTSNMGAVEHFFSGKKQLFIPGSATVYPLKSVLVLVRELASIVDLSLLAASHDNTPASAGLITARGGRGVVGKMLKPFRELLPAFLLEHRDVIYAPGLAVCSVDGEKKIVQLLKELRPCRVMPEVTFTTTMEPFVWINRLDHSSVIGEHEPMSLLEDELPRPSLFSPQSPSSAPPLTSEPRREKHSITKRDPACFFLKLFILIVKLFK